MKLYSYFRSSASYRVRIALQLKGLEPDYIPVHLVRREQLLPEHTALSPDGLVPVLEVGGDILTQSMAIIEYLEETCPTPALLPESAVDRAHVRALAQSIACEIHPLNNLRVLSYLVKEIKVDEDTKMAWYHHWVRSGLEAFERQLASHAARRQTASLPPSVYCHGATPTLADCCLVPQIFNAQRFGTQLDGLPHTMAAFDACMQLAAFQNAHPSRCPDAAP